MNKIFITGDIHGSISVNRFSSHAFPEGKSLTKDDYVIIVGDFGLLWDGGKEDRYWLKWLNDKPWTTLFIDGNHENFDMLDSYPVEQWNGGKIHRIMPNIIHLMRGQMFDIHGKKFFTFGGASSIDKEHRKEGISWWAREIPSYAEFEEGLSTLDKSLWICDYVITHNCSTRTLQWMANEYGFELKPTDSVNEYLDTIENKIKYKYWFFGHFHQNLNLPRNQIMLYDQIIEIL
jgi:DNA repair exonuclease SbcCD nuclease subunit